MYREWSNADDQKKIAATEYKNLVDALVIAGTPLESIKILVQSSEILAPAAGEDDQTTEEDASESENTHLSSRNDSFDNDSGHYSLTNVVSLPTPSPSGEEIISGDEGADLEKMGVSKQLGHVHRGRSVLLRGIPKSASLRDVCKIVRGGMILNLFLRPHQNTAHVSFVNPQAAEDFLLHADRTDLYVKGRKIMASWDKRPCYLNKGLAQRIQRDGATRNLVVRFPRPEITAALILDDLEHIHRLEVLEVHFRDGHAWISLNGIRQSITARSCMLSRLRYRGCRIDFWPDECDQSPPTTRQQASEQRWQHPSKFPTIFTNRFLALRGGSNEPEGNGKTKF